MKIIQICDEFFSTLILICGRMSTNRTLAVYGSRAHKMRRGERPKPLEHRGGNRRELLMFISPIGCGDHLELPGNCFMLHPSTYGSFYDEKSIG